ncbi:hypothetical protein Q7A53_19945 [Halobacillus rhizosphaerae]|uniref:hypothetical protein n=1 Tax=Halobacillus rhizosphaerae TaxID=3064889 RepID=UPI00398AE03A
MTNKMIGLIAVYAVIMAGLLYVTFAEEWNPSGNTYSVEDQTLTIEQGVFSKDTRTIDMKGKQADVLRYFLAMSVEREHWRQDLTVIGLILPFLLFIFYRDRRPFKSYVSYGWYVTIIAAIAVLYAAYSIPGHVSEIQDIHQQVNQLTS